MWIRSQDKEKLVNVNNGFYIDYTEFDMNKENQLRCIYGDDVKLGTYSTKEKALKVLDMIQECIEFNNSSHNSQWDSTPYCVYNVFQMLQDDEVEENEKNTTYIYHRLCADTIGGSMYLVSTRWRVCPRAGVGDLGRREYWYERGGPQRFFSLCRADPADLAGVFCAF